jgi:deazaflavin-dependent oxidoreductase (nitroreductase family)
VRDVARRLYRIPLHLPDAALAVLRATIGVEWIAVTTRGRRSGRPHTVMVDVVGRCGDGWYASPSRRDADWVRNARADPRVVVRARGRVVAARWRDATGAEGADVVLGFLRAHPWYAAAIVRMVGYDADLSASEAALRAQLARWPLFALEAGR